jgi:hypothetical protein
MWYLLTHPTMIFVQTIENQWFDARFVKRILQFLGSMVPDRARPAGSTATGGAEQEWFNRFFSILVVVTFASTGAWAQVSNTTQGTSYASIAAAIDAANPGDAIVVAAGSYSEPKLIIDTSISLTGAASGSTTVESTSNGYGAYITANGVSISGITLNGAGTYGLKAYNVSNLTLSDVAVTNSTNSAIDLSNVSTATLSGIQAHGATDGFGLAIASSSNVTVTTYASTGNAWGDASVFPAAVEYQTSIEAPSNIVFGGTLALGSLGGISVESGALASGGSWTGSVSGNGGVDVVVPDSYTHVVLGQRIDGATAQIAVP